MNHNNRYFTGEEAPYSKSETNLESTITTSQGATFPCPYCGKFLSTKGNLKQHISAIHLQIKLGDTSSGVAGKELLEKIALPCKERKQGCRQDRKHYHCKGCKIYTAFHFSRLEKHYKKCWRRFAKTAVSAAFSSEAITSVAVEQERCTGSSSGSQQSSQI